MCTMQAPHNPVPQPNLVPVSLRSSRITHNSGVAGGASVAAGLPFTMKFVAIASSLDPRGAKAFAGLPDHPARWERLQWPNPDHRREAANAFGKWLIGGLLMRLDAAEVEIMRRGII